MAIQKVMAERNAAIEPERRMHLRMGTKFGDIISDGAKIFGDAVNIAARLESVADGRCDPPENRPLLARREHGSAVGNQALKSLGGEA
jgi:class 3 adenylate cyclase